MLRWGRWLAPALCAAIAGTAYGIYSGAIDVPYRFNPWAPLDVMASPDWLTGSRLQRAATTPRAVSAR